MVTSPHAQATAAGVDVLRRGGNAVDAAIATNAVLTVVYPASCSIGGDALWLVYNPQTRETLAYNGSGRTPAGAVPLDDLPERGALAVTVPGAVRSWEDVLHAHGTRSLDELLAPAEQYARDGFVATDIVAAYIASNAALLAKDEHASALFLPAEPIRAGDRLVNTDLADTLAAIRHGGAEAFYTGAVGEAILRTLRAGGNRMTIDDFAQHRTETTMPVRLPWHGGELLAHPPNSHGSVLLLAMGMLAGDGASDAVTWNHLAIEAMKIALAIRDEHFGDPAFHAVDLAAMLAPQALAARRAGIDAAHARGPVAAGGGDTVALNVVDERGGAVSLIQSLYMPFGAGIVAGGTGIVLHNRGAFFVRDAGHPNEYAPAKRPLHTLAPAMFVRDGRPTAVFGTMGGNGQPQIQAQFLHNVFERSLDVQRAIDEPRWIQRESLIVESRMDPALVAGLRDRGHDPEIVDAYDNAMGHASAIIVDRERGTLAGGADPRADSSALGL